MEKPRLTVIVDEKLKPLKPAEERLLNAAQDGEPLPLTVDDEGEPRRPDLPEDWNDANTIRADVIKWLCTVNVAKELVSHKGLQVLGAKITGKLDLQFADIPFPLGLFACVFDDDIILQHAKVRALNLNGSRTKAVSANGLKIDGDVYMRYGFKAEGEVSLIGADIDGDLNCRGGSFENKEGHALCVDGVKVKGSVFLDRGFHAQGEVRLNGADIGGQLSCTGGNFENMGGYSLNADSIKVKGSVFLNKGFLAKGEVCLLGAEMGGQLNCRNGSFENKERDALNACGVKVKGDVFLNEGFHAQGEVALPGADIGGNLECTGGNFENKEGDALCAERMKVEGNFSWKTWERPVGAIDLLHAKVGQLSDNRESWPEKGKLLIDGFEYDALAPDATPKTAEERLEWIRLQKPTPFKPQPYEQLAKVFRAMGHESDARNVLVAKQEDLRKYGKLSRLAWFANLLLAVTIGHGWKPIMAILYIITIVSLGSLFFWCAEETKVMQPSKERVYMSKEYKKDGAVPSTYPKFNHWVYSVDTFVPFVNLHQENYWLPDASKPSGQWFRFYLWLHIISGWVFSTLAALSLTGIVRKE